MAHRSKPGRLSGISTQRELRQARRDIELRLWYAERRLADRVEGGMAVVRGVMKAIELFRSRRRKEC